MGMISSLAGESHGLAVGRAMVIQPEGTQEPSFMDSSVNDPFDLQRFVSAQSPVIETVKAELSAGFKRSHWMWFVFPQLSGLGKSATSRRYALSGLAEARAYLAHPKLGERLRECTRLVLAIRGRTAQQIFGQVDACKFHSSMTLFSLASPTDPLFAEALARYHGGRLDQETLVRLDGSGEIPERPEA